MATIGKSVIVPERKFLEELPRISESEVVVFFKPDHAEFKTRSIALSVLATCVSRYGSPISATELLKVSQIGIFATWEIKREVGQLCDLNYFSRKHIGLEEYFTVEMGFLDFVKQNTVYERISA